MRIYFYHTQDIQFILSKMERGEFPSHFLYGATRLPKHGIDVVWHRSRMALSRWRLMLYNTWQILTRHEHFDAIYATHYRGLELIIFMRALGLYRRPIVIWHHQPIVRSSSFLREAVGKLFYRGIDRMFFFSQKLVDDSLKTGKARPDKLILGHWGADLEFYDRVMKEREPREGFISTGKEKRDMATLVEAFNATGAPIDIYLNPTNGSFSYEKQFESLQCNDNVKVHFMTALAPYELSLLVNRAACAVICCQETKYTVGLTTVVEALALGLPIICSRNPQIPVDMEQDGCGISVPYYDSEGWQKAITYIQTHPKEAQRMGEKGRQLAEREFNDERCASEVASILKSL